MTLAAIKLKENVISSRPLEVNQHVTGRHLHSLSVLVLLNQTVMLRTVALITETLFSEKLLNLLKYGKRRLWGN